MFDLQVQEFKQKMISEINSSNLPLSIILYIVKDLEKAVGDALTQQIEMEKAQRAQQQDSEDLGLIDINLNEEC